MGVATASLHAAVATPLVAVRATKPRLVETADPAAVLIPAAFSEAS